MGVSTSTHKHKKFPFLICSSGASAKVSNGASSHNTEEAYVQSRTDETESNNGSTTPPNKKLSIASLRTINRSSLKPGRKFSLHYQGDEVQLPEMIKSTIDPDNVISIHDLYNILNDGAMKPFIHDPFNILIIDSRDLPYFAANHVITGKHHAKFMALPNLTMVVSNYSMIIVYGSRLCDDQDSQELLNLVNDIKEYAVQDILILKEGFETFHSVYPFLCSDAEIESITDRKMLMSYPSMVLDNQLWQGRGDQATNSHIVSVLKITHIVNITMEHKNAFSSKIKYLKVNLEDVPKSNLYEHFHKTSDFINNAIKNGGRVLVHCNQGVSRSSTITIAYLMKHKKWHLDLAFTTLKARRSCSCPNAGFFIQLSDWEEHIFGSKFTNIDSL